MPMKRAQLAIFEASAKILPDGSKNATCLTAIWTFGRIENQMLELERANGD
jgi:hypothetical protein